MSDTDQVDPDPIRAAAAIERSVIQNRQGMDAVRAGDFQLAAECFAESIRLDPSNTHAHNNLGSAFAALNRQAEAAAAYRQAVNLDPYYVQALANLGTALFALGERQAAADCYLKAIEIDPQFGPAYYYLGQAHQSSGRPNEAAACYLRAADLNPGDGDVYAALGSVLVELRLRPEAISAFERVLAIDPTMSGSRAHLMHLLASDCDWERLAEHLPMVEEMGISGDLVPPFTMLAFEDSPERHRIRSQRFAEANYGAIEPMPRPARPSVRPDKLRIGYFSADFHDHATMFLAARLFELHDRDRFSVNAYSYGSDESGSMRLRAERSFDDFKHVAGMNDRSIAELAREDGIDIAVDLKGYTKNQRLGIFAYRPSPIQISYLGYPGTLGGSFIDYLVADRTVVPVDQRDGYAEKIIYMPDSYQVNDDRRTLSSSGSRSDAGLPAEGFVFCCFNNSYKITPVEFDIWMSLLKQVGGSVLWLLAKNERVAANLRHAARSSGVDPDHLIFAARVDPAAHLARQAHADLFLDTFNCNAHTTASDALWAGLPLITKAGSGFAARVAASVLRAMDLGELIVENERDYTGLAFELAGNEGKLAAIRAKLQANRLTTPLFDSEKFTRHLEKGFELAYAAYLEGRPPVDIVVQA